MSSPLVAVFCVYLPSFEVCSIFFFERLAWAKRNWPGARRSDCGFV